ncbi:hypothetical protein [Modestobacter lapidis]
MIDPTAVVLPLLNPRRPAVLPAGARRVRDALLDGLPATVPLTGELELAVLLPDALGDWRAAPAELVVSAGGTGTADLDPGTAAATAVVRPTLAVRDRTATLAAYPAVAGGPGAVPGADGAVVVHLVLAGWRLALGSLVGPGASGSWIEFAWWWPAGDRTPPGTAVRPRVRDRAATAAAAPAARAVLGRERRSLRSRRGPHPVRRPEDLP